MTELIRSYLLTAKLLKDRINELSQLIKMEADVEKHNSLVARKELLSQERYEMLAVVAQMLEYEEDKKLASGI